MIESYIYVWPDGTVSDEAYEWMSDDYTVVYPERLGEYSQDIIEAVEDYLDETR